MTLDAEVQAELRAAMRRVNVAYMAAREPRPAVGWCRVDDLLEASLKQPDRDKAIRLIAAWEEHHLQEFAKAGVP